MDDRGLKVLKDYFDYQLKLPSRANWDDLLPPGVSISSTCTTPVPNVDSCSPAAHDWEFPVPAHTDPDSIHIEGLERVGAMDISYWPESRDDTASQAIGALVVLKFPSMEILYSVVRPVRVAQPYIPEFLGAREGPVYLELYDAALAQLGPDKMPQVFMFDGYGRCHQRQAGMATAVAVERDLVAVGVAKEYHTGLSGERTNVEQSLALGRTTRVVGPGHFRSAQATFKQRARELLLRKGDWMGMPLGPGGPIVGAALCARDPPSRAALPSPAPIFVSSAHRVSLQSALAITLACCRKNRVPEPVFHADRLGREEVRRLREEGSVGASETRGL